MRLLRIGEHDHERPAVLVDESDPVARDVSTFVADFDGDFFAGDGLERLRALIGSPAVSEFPAIDVTRTRLGPPIATPGQVICVGLNYRDHAAESGMPVPTEPVLFNKAPGTVIGPNDDVLLPPGAQKVDWEVELAVVVGRQARYLESPEDAEACIAGYAISNDVSERAYQLERGGQWVKGKSCETFNPLGPWLLTADELVHREALDLSLSVNGAQMQVGSTSNMIFRVDHIIWYVSQFMVLQPGDLINTGTPPGVGMGQEPARYLQEGDIMELAISQLGAQTQRCVRVDLESKRAMADGGAA